MLFSLLTEANRLFSSLVSFYEVAAEANMVYSTTVANLPDESQLEAFISSFRSNDNLELSIRSYLDFIYDSSSPDLWKSEYSKFLNSSETEDKVEITIHVNKRFDDRDTLSIYCFDKFMEYYNQLPLMELLSVLAASLKRHSHLCFYVMDREINVSTNSICFYNDASMQSRNSKSRDELMNHCNASSLFLNRTEISLCPYDFKIIHDVSNDSHSVVALLQRLETIFSFLFLVNSSYIQSNQAVLQIAPSSANITIPLDQFENLQSVCNLFYWAFSGDYTIERVGIVRNLLEINCRKSADLFLIDDTLLSSAKSNYILYQKKTVDKYIELKNLISSSIIDAANSMQEIIQTLVDALRNNFVAVIMFLVTVIITDSINWDNLISGSILNQDLLLIIRVFCIASFLYLLVTLSSVIFKWRFFAHSYKELKKNYEELLDSEDLARAFDNDKAINYVKGKIIFASSLVAAIWMIFLVAVVLLCI